MSADVSVDKTILIIQAGIFLLSYGVLRKLVFGPYGQLLKERERKTTLLKQVAQRQMHEAVKTQERYEEFIKAERRKIQRWVEEERKQVSEEEKRIVQSAREGANAKLAALRVRLAQEVVETRKALLPKTAEFASQLASAILGRNVTVSSKTGSEKGREEAALS